MFDDIRPYNDSEIPAAMHRIAHSDVFPLLASFVYPDIPLEKVRQRVENFKNTHEFQFDTMYKVNEQIIARTMTEFTCSGIERLKPDEAYLYISNHRDIMLDSSLMQFYLANNGFETTEITFGANLMMHPVVIDVGKSNKMFKVERPGDNMREFYQSSLKLSQYIRHVITQKHESVWIAQRNGRTKDGYDKTDQGIIKMFGLSESNDKIKALADLHIVPVSISYEWESCDVLKTLELYESQFMRYTKKPGEDLCNCANPSQWTNSWHLMSRPASSITSRWRDCSTSASMQPIASIPTTTSLTTCSMATCATRTCTPLSSARSSSDRWHASTATTPSTSSACVRFTSASTPTLWTIRYKIIDYRLQIIDNRLSIYASRA